MTPPTGRPARAGLRASRAWASCSTSRAPTGTWRSARSPRSTTAASPRRRCCSTTSSATRAGYRVLTGSLSNARRMAVTLGLDPESRHRRAWSRRCAASRCEWEAAAPRFEPEVRRDRARSSRTSSRAATSTSRASRRRCWHEHDGGRYIGTGVAVVTSDPDTGRINVGAYRMMIQEDGRSATINAEAGKQGRAQYERWFAKHGKAPVLASFGHDPLLLMVAGTEVPNTISEYAYAGAMVGREAERRPRRGDRPADAGRRRRSSSKAGSVPTACCRKGRSASGPATTPARSRPVPTIDIERLYFRNDPIILGAPPGKPPNDYSYMRALLKSAMIQDELVQGRRARRARRLGARDRRRPPADRRLDQAALLRPLAPGRLHHRPVPGRRLHEPLRHRRGRRRGSDEPRRGDVGGEHALRAGRGHRDHAQVVGQQGGPAARRIRRCRTTRAR